MNWTDRLERRFGFLAIPGLGRYVVSLQVLCFIAALANPDLVNRLILDPALVAQGEWWRLLTFVCVPSLTPLNILFAVFFFWFQWMVFEGIEAEWGSFKLTLYCALGWLCSLALPLLAWTAAGQDAAATGFYWSLSIELAFAYLYPDYTIYLFLILPVKMKWVAWFIGAFLLYQVFTEGLWEALPVAVGLLNYLVFFGPDFLNRGRRTAQVRKGRLAFDAAKREAARSQAPRVCCQCGAGVDGELRLCSCAACGGDGRFWCARHLPGHLAEIQPPKADPPSTPSGTEPVPGPRKRGNKAKGSDKKSEKT